MAKSLVIDGEELEFPSFATANFDGDRVPLPARLIEQLHLTGEEPVDCLLAVMSAGRYRVVLNAPSSHSQTDGVNRLLKRWKEVGAQADFLEGAFDNEQAALRARLLPTSISRMGTGWRITIPKEAKQLMSAHDESSFLFVLLVAGFVELWFPDTLRQAVSVPVARALR